MSTSNAVSSQRILCQSYSSSGLKVQKSFILSLIFFLVAMGWVICETTSDRPRGIQWSLVSHLEEPDFADDLANTSATHQPSPGKIQLTKQFCKANRSAHDRYKDPADLLMSMPLQHSQSPSVEWELAIAAGLHYLKSLISSDKGAHN